MTFREKLQKEHPEYIGQRYIGGCSGCPDAYGYEKERPCNVSSNYKCSKCWDREIPGTEEKESNIMDIHKIIDDAMEKKDRRVSVFIMENSTSINVEPWNDGGRRDWVTLEIKHAESQLSKVIGFKCPECGSESYKKTPYCPICGEALKGE